MYILPKASMSLVQVCSAALAAKMLQPLCSCIGELSQNQCQIIGRYSKTQLDGKRHSPASAYTAAGSMPP